MSTTWPSPTCIELSDAVSVWIDYLSRDLIQDGYFERMMRQDAVVGVTSNPTTSRRRSVRNAYDDQLREVLEETDDPKEIFVALASKDVGDACDFLRKVWDEGGGKDGYVSIEVDPTLAYDTEETVDQATRFTRRSIGRTPS